MQLANDNTRVAGDPKTLSEAKAILRKLGLSLYRTPWQEYRVNFIGAGDDTAYFSPYWPDAYATGVYMYHEKRAKFT